MHTYDFSLRKNCRELKDKVKPASRIENFSAILPKHFLR
jgi:hypothetical protein